MRIFRAALAALIALSVALGPATAGFAVASATAATKAGLPSKSGAKRTEVSSAVHCHHDRMPTQPESNNCQAAAGCAAKCFSLYGIMFPDAVLAPDFGQPEPLMASQSLDYQTGTPPFRPPRVWHLPEDVPLRVSRELAESALGCADTHAAWQTTDPPGA